LSRHSGVVMKFKLYFDRDELITCELCGSESFKLVTGRKLCEIDRDGVFMFYRCSRCGEMGFWTHQQTIDKSRRISRAISKEFITADRRTAKTAK